MIDDKIILTLSVCFIICVIMYSYGEIQGETKYKEELFKDWNNSNCGNYNYSVSVNMKKQFNNKISIWFPCQ